jgi:RNA polymerase sigma factor (sigma-70 family)
LYAGRGGVYCADDEEFEAVSDGELLELVEAYEPFVGKIAYRYGGRGAEVEDLKQVGYMALTVLARRISRKKLGLALSNFMPGIVRDAAASMRYRGGDVRMPSRGDDGDDSDELGIQAVEDRRAEDDRDGIELMDTLERLLAPSDLTIAKRLLQGFSQSDIASELRVSQQAISRRLVRIRSLIGCLRN